MFVVAAAFAPKLVSRPNEVSVRNSSTESAFIEPTTITASDTTTTESPTVTTVAASTTTTGAPATTTTRRPTTTTTVVAPTTTTTISETSDPRVRAVYPLLVEGDNFIVNLSTQRGSRVGLVVQVTLVPTFQIDPATQAGQVQLARGYTVTFDPGATSASLTVPRSDFVTANAVAPLDVLPVNASPLVTGYTWDAGSHGIVNSATMEQDSKS